MTPSGECQGQQSTNGQEPVLGTLRSFAEALETPLSEVDTVREHHNVMWDVMWDLPETPQNHLR